MLLVIAEETPASPDVVALLETHLAFSSAASPSDHVHALDLDGLLTPEITFCCARSDGELLGVGALRDLGDGRAEIKSMHTAAAARGRGIGRRMVGHLTTLAREQGAIWLGLETGSMDEFAPARAMYESIGFVTCPPFGDYSVNPFSICMAMDLTQTLR